MATLEDVLAARAFRDSNAQPSALQTSGLGAAVGGLAGMALPGGIKTRMAGGLVGTILGGGLGLGTKALMANESEAGRLLAKLQLGTMTDVDKYALENLLADTYSSGAI